MQAPAPVRNNPNASLAGGLSAVSLLVVNVAGWSGVSLTTGQAVVIGGAVTTAGLWVGKAGALVASRGIVGICRMIWRGDGP